jgi:hypothetical protein
MKLMRANIGLTLALKSGCEHFMALNRPGTQTHGGNAGHAMGRPPVQISRAHVGAPLDGLGRGQLGPPHHVGRPDQPSHSEHGPRTAQRPDISAFRMGMASIRAKRAWAEIGPD